MQHVPEKFVLTEEMLVHVQMLIDDLDLDTIDTCPKLLGDEYWEQQEHKQVFGIAFRQAVEKKLIKRLIEVGRNSANHRLYGRVK